MYPTIMAEFVLFLILVLLGLVTCDMMYCDIRGQKIVTIPRSFRNISDRSLLAIHHPQHEYQRDLLYYTNDTLQVRRCWCASGKAQEVLFCLSEYSECAVDVNDGSQVCMKINEATHVLRGVFPVILFFWSCLLFVFIGSEQGASARAFIYRKVVTKCGRDHVKEEQVLNASADRLQRRNPERARFLFQLRLRRYREHRRSIHLRELRRHGRELRRHERESIRRERLVRRRGDQVTITQQPDMIPDTNVPSADSTESQLQPRPNQLVLKTRKYKVQVETGTGNEAEASKATSWIINTFRRTSSADDEVIGEELDNRCAICLSLLEEGDRIGDLECGHMFHTACLKPWLQRKNQCPLCLCDGVAEPRFYPNTPGDEEVGNHPTTEPSTHQD